MELKTPDHSSGFVLRRTQNWFVLGLTYASMYMGRYNFSFANKSLSDQYGWSKAQIGGIISIATLVYGVAALFNGPIADRIGGRKAMIVGATGAFIFNILFGIGAYLHVLGTGPLLFAYFSAIWTLNMFFQSYSALALIKVNSGWFHVGERGVFSSIFGSMIQLGRAGVYWLLPLPIIAVLPWEWKFFIPAAAIGVMTIVTIFVVQDTPRTAGLPEFDTQDATSGDTEAVTFSYIARKVFTNPIAITIAVAEFCTGLMRKGFEEWFPRFMQEAQHLKLESPIFRTGAFIIVLAGIAGAVVAGVLSDKVFGSRRAPVAFIGYALVTTCLWVIWHQPSVPLLIAAFVVNSMGISMVHSMLSGTASMDFGGQRAAASAAGLFDGMQYIGGSLAGYGIGKLVDLYGWGAWAPSMIGFAAIGGVLMLFLWNARPKRAAAH